MRVLALWYPDWPAQVLSRTTGSGPDVPVVVHDEQRVWVVNHAGRRRGVVRGMRLRAAQMICPEALTSARDDTADGEAFAAIVESLSQVAATIEVLRPGLVLVAADSLARYYGSEDRAVDLAMTAASEQGVDLRTGVADELATAIIAARAGRLGAVVPAGGGRAFLHQVGLGVIGAESSLGIGPGLVGQLAEMGVRTCGELVALPREAVATRFSAAGMRLYEICAADTSRLVAPALDAGPGEAVVYTPEEPIMRVDQAAFIARSLAARLHEQLAAAGQVCVQLSIQATVDDGATQFTLERIWRTFAPLDESATADRVRWQLGGWITSRQQQAGSEEEGLGAGIVQLQLIPMETEQPSAEAGLWQALGDSTQRAERAEKVITRVQSRYGTDTVLRPFDQGGRGAEERIGYVSSGEHIPEADTGRWPGRLPAPLPTRRGPGWNHPASRIGLVDANGEPVVLVEDLLLSAAPEVVVWGSRRLRVSGWAGPWPVDEQWWSAQHAQGGGIHPAHARLQLTAGDDSRVYGWVLVWVHGAWRIEASYC
ncbi:DNA polymerase IV [Corynebacterium ciconiae DSM 44920]|uniref:Y-family DNA polymerase n=1 Tax=Corynebacterium ciconiae TaxID=227319 RepID=UPI0004765C3B|nr:DNA polymerase Y family protein [Corynebacterium ciconiae]WKD61892.1 DNA polymerase IV [Corynebacterium ciconiae DSM 44920]